MCLLRLGSGDEIDAAYQEEIQEVVEMTGSPESAFRIFNDVVKNVFEWDENTGAGIMHVHCMVDASSDNGYPLIDQAERMCIIELSIDTVWV